MDEELLVGETDLEYHTTYWWADGESETLVTYFGDKSLTHEEKVARCIQLAKEHLEQEKGLDDPQVKAQVTTFKLVTYRKGMQTHWNSD